MGKYFGTDGIRGRAGTDLNPELVLRACYAMTTVLKKRTGVYSKGKRPFVVLGADSRLSAPMLRSAAASGVMLGGFDVLDLGTVPTPAVSLVLLQKKASGGIMVTASHNPVEDNGIKLFGIDGRKLSANAEAQIEKHIDSAELTKVDEQISFGSLTEYDASGDYLKHALKGWRKRTKTQRRLSIVLDCANGATSNLAPLAFKKAGFKLHVINAEFDGHKTNVNCGATHLGKLSREVRKRKADFGIAFDGDGDRMLAVDGGGKPVSGDKIIALFATRLPRYKKQGKVVMTKMTNLGVERQLGAQGIKMLRTEVGDINVMKEMLASKVDLGGEQSGHIIMLDKLPAGDGIVAGLQLARVIQSSAKPLSELAAAFPEYPQQLTNLRVKDKAGWKKDKQVNARLAKIQKDYNEVRFYLRPSGTENLVRVLTESRDKDLCKRGNEAVCKVFSDWDNS